MRDDKLIEAMRESFEAWFSDDWQHPSAVERDAVGYKLAQAQNAWTVWQAAWQAAITALRNQEPEHSERHGDLRIDRLYADYYGDVRYD